jgi:hypothetical protein
MVGHNHEAMQKIFPLRAVVVQDFDEKVCAAVGLQQVAFYDVTKKVRNVGGMADGPA